MEGFLKFKMRSLPVTVMLLEAASAELVTSSQVVRDWLDIDGLATSKYITWRTYDDSLPDIITFYESFKIML